VSVPSPREHDERTADEAPPAQPPAPAHVRYPVTSIYLCVMVGLILLAVLFEWRL
jgi:hypothetical protein